MDPGRIRGSTGWIRCSERAKPGHTDADLETQNRRFSFVNFIPELEAKMYGSTGGPGWGNVLITFENVDTKAISPCKNQSFMVTL